MAELARLADELEQEVSDYAVEFTATTVENLEDETPKDSTLASRSWKVAVGQVDPVEPIPTEADILSLSPREDALRRLAGYSIFDGDVIIYTKVPYVHRLDRGYSAQAPDGFVEDVLLRVIAELD